MIMLHKSHLNIKTNKFCQVPVCIAVLSTENFKFKVKELISYGFTWSWSMEDWETTREASN